MPKLIDERFHRYGRLVVLDRAGSKKDGHIAWFCRCDCGNFTIVSSQHLRGGNTKSCGCLQKERSGQAHNKLPKGQAAFNRILRDYKVGARDRNLEWSLTDEQVKRLITQPCYYCGAKPRLHSDFIASYTCNGNFLYTGIDRVNNSKGYSPDNVVSCCSLCNYMKQTISQDLFKKQIANIYNHLNLQNKNKKE